MTADLESHVRHAVQSDREGTLAVAEASGLFGPEELAFLGDLFDRQYADPMHAEDKWVVDRSESSTTGIAYYAPERMASGTWNLYLITIHPKWRDRGRGSALTRFVEQDLESSGQRLLLVETSGLPEFANTREFYRRRGYREEARIHEFYASGNDKIVFRKALRT